MTQELLSLMQHWDGQGVVIRYDRPTGTWVFIAMHSSRLGMPIGGCRMKVYPTPADGLRDALRLARGMTYKLAAVDFEFGGGKSVLAVPRLLEGAEREGLLRRFGRLLDSLHGAYATGIDLGTTPADMKILAQETRWVFVGDPDTGHSDPGPYTALGVFRCMEVVAERLRDGGLKGRTVVLQGVGDVGARLAEMVADAGARLRLADIDRDRVAALADRLGADVIATETVNLTPCDILAPCAVGGTLNRETIPRLQCRAVVGSANNQLEEDADAERLRERGIIYAPDYIVNAGGAIAYAMMHQGERNQEAINARIRRIGDSLGAILDEAKERGETPLAAAMRRVEEKLEKGEA